MYLFMLQLPHMNLLKRIGTSAVLLLTVAIFIKINKFHYLAAMIHVGLVSELIYLQIKKTIPKSLMIYGSIYALLPLFLLHSVFSTAAFISLCVACIVDVSGYVGGRIASKITTAKKLAPTISPNKTIAGAICGFISLTLIHICQTNLPITPAIFWMISLAVCIYFNKLVVHLLLSSIMLAIQYFTPMFTYPTLIQHLQPVILCYQAFLTALAGDLLVSYFKRKYHIKDTSNFLPGHGGFWDRFDAYNALMFMTTIAYNLSCSNIR